MDEVGGKWNGFRFHLAWGSSGFKVMLLVRFIIYLLGQTRSMRAEITRALNAKFGKEKKRNPIESLITSVMHKVIIVLVVQYSS